MTEQEKECIISIKSETGGSDDECVDTTAHGAALDEEKKSLENSRSMSTLSPTINLNQSSSDVANNTNIEENTNQESYATSKSQQNINPAEVYRKLEIIKEIKNKTSNLQRIKAKLANEVEFIETETKSVASFKTELDLLIQEKIAHLEELKQIHMDIAMMEDTIRQSDEEKRRALESAKRLHTEYKPLKEQINQLRDSIGLEKTDDNNDEDLIETFLEKLSLGAQNEKSKCSGTSSQSSSKQNGSVSNVEFSKPNQKSPQIEKQTSRQRVLATNQKQHESTEYAKQQTTHEPKKKENLIDLPVQLATAALMAHSMQQNQTANSFNPHHHQAAVAAAAAAAAAASHHYNPFLLAQANNLTENNNNNINNEQQQQQLHSIPPPFRQQPPPMKSCLSCHQQIHRNAPICPLCKAKSRSRNPKKPKKKMDSNEQMSPSNSIGNKSDASSSNKRK